jgi:hypothetical protein
VSITDSVPDLSLGTYAKGAAHAAEKI